MGSLTSDYGVEALLATRARFFLLYRLAVRLQQLRGFEGAAHQSGRWQIVLVIFIVLDIAMWRLLQDPRRFAFKSRLTLDGLDMAVWSVGPYPPGATYDVVVFAAVPLAMEAGLRMGAGAVAVPAVGLASTAVARSAAGLPFSPTTVLWLVGSVGGGWLLRGYDRRLRRQVQQAWADQRSADERRAFLAGQNSIAMGASSVVDGIESVVPLLGPPPRHSALELLAHGWKADLGLSTRALSSEGGSTAVYLGDALAEWSAEHNRHPDLSSRVELPLAEGAGTILLTGDQAAALRYLLTDLDLVGRHRVQLIDHQAHARPPGKSLRLRVGSHELMVPADRDQPPRPCDPAPLAFLLVPAQIVRDLSPAAVYLPGPIAAAGIGCFLAASVWSHFRLRERGLEARRAILWVAIGLAAVWAVLANLTMRHPFAAAGRASYTFAEGLLVVLLLLGMYEGGMDRAERSAAALGVATIVALGLLLHPAHETDPYAVGRQLLQPWLIVLYLSGRKASTELRNAEARYAAELRSGDATAVAAAFRRGQKRVVELVREARDDAVQQLTRIESELDPRLLESATHRLRDVDTRLATLVMP